ncbi:hypothetical protein Hanom_Chr05g00467071 [Helianthus anomalus]
MNEKISLIFLTRPLHSYVKTSLPNPNFYKVSLCCVILEPFVKPSAVDSRSQP